MRGSVSHAGAAFVWAGAVRNPRETRHGANQSERPRGTAAAERRQRFQREPGHQPGVAEVDDPKDRFAQGPATLPAGYLSPIVLERLLIHRRPCALSLDKLATVALAPWAKQSEVVFED